ASDRPALQTSGAARPPEPSPPIAKFNPPAAAPAMPRTMSSSTPATTSSSPPAPAATPAHPVSSGSGGAPRIDEMLRAMKKMGASDLHMSCTMPPLVRKDGEMQPVPGFPTLTPDLMLQLLYEIAPEKNRKEFEERSDTDFAHSIEGLSRFRANMFRD